MTKYAHIKDGAVYRIVDLTAEQIADIPPHKAAYLLPYIEVARPVFGAATHHAPVRLPDDIQVDQVVQVWAAAVAKTAQELDADKDRVLDRYDILTFKVLFNHENRIRALEGQSARTAAQFRAALKALL